jgi:hypothetical protein
MTSRRPKTKAPPGCYWRGDVLWGRIRKGGKTIMWSLKTGDIHVARARFENAKRLRQPIAYLDRGIAVVPVRANSRDLDRLASRHARLVAAEARHARGLRLYEIVHRHALKVFADYFWKPEPRPADLPPGSLMPGTLCRKCAERRGAVAAGRQEL